MVKAHLPYYIRQSISAGSVTIYLVLLGIVTLFVLQIESLSVWVLCLVLSILSPAYLYFSTIMFSLSRKIQNEADLQKHAEGIAALEVNDYKKITFFMICCISLFFVWASTRNFPILHTLLSILIVLTLGLSILPLIKREFELFRYCYVARELNPPVDHMHVEIWYEAGIAQERKRARKTLYNIIYQNYCAIRQGVCDKSIIYEGPRSCFFAYPFSKSNRQRMLALKKKLKASQYPVLLPTDNDFAEVLVCKLCRMILSCQHFVAEVSVSNRNVYFEYGMAKGFEKKVWLLSIGKDRSNKALKTVLLEDTIQIRRHRFRSREVGFIIERDILSLVARMAEPMEKKVLLSDFERFSPNNCRHALIIGPHNWELLQTSIDMEYDKFASLLMEKTRRIGLDVIKSFPQAASHHVANVLDTIDKNNILIAILADDKKEDFEDINSVISFLVGYALAKEKRIMVLQKEHCDKKMLDLKGKIASFKNADDLNQICETLLDDVLLHTIPSTYLAPLE